MKKLIYQGAEGSFSELAALEAFGSKVVLEGKETFLSLYEALDKGEAEIAIIPIENTLIGSIWENYDLMHQFDIQIIGEKLLKIEHCLLGLEGGSLSALKRVYSHPKALDQCRAFFRSHPWIEPVVHYDTAGAAAMLSAKKDPEEGAIASIQTAQLYSLRVLKTAIADNPQNFTRFLFLQKRGKVYLTEGGIEANGNKCSLLLTLKHVPGALSQVLQHFAEKGINLTKIESRPIVGKPFEYLFFIDLQFDCDQREVLRQVLQHPQEIIQASKILGVYDEL